LGILLSKSTQRFPSFHLIFILIKAEP